MSKVIEKLFKTSEFAQISQMATKTTDSLLLGSIIRGYSRLKDHNGVINTWKTAKAPLTPMAYTVLLSSLSASVIHKNDLAQVSKYFHLGQRAWKEIASSLEAQKTSKRNTARLFSHSTTTHANAMIKLCTAAFQVGGFLVAKEIYRTLSNPDHRTYSLMLTLCAKEKSEFGNIVWQNASNSKMIDDYVLAAYLSFLIETKEFDRVPPLVAKFYDSQFKITNHVLGLLIHASLQVKSPSLGLQWYEKAISSGTVPDEGVLRSLTFLLLETNEYQKAFETASKMDNNGSLKLLISAKACSSNAQLWKIETMKALTELEKQSVKLTLEDIVNVLHVFWKAKAWKEAFSFLKVYEKKLLGSTIDMLEESLVDGRNNVKLMNVRLKGLDITKEILQHSKGHIRHEFISERLHRCFELEKRVRQLKI